MIPAIARLTKLGFSEYEAKAYTALLKNNPLTGYEIAKYSGIPSSKIYEVMRRLEHRNTVHSIQGERARLFMPVSPEEFVENFRSAVEDNLEIVQRDLKAYKISIDTNYTWHMGTYDALLQRAKRMLNTSNSDILLLTWASELVQLVDQLQKAQDRGVNIAIVHYGVTSVQIGQIYLHPIEESIYASKGTKGITLVADSREALIGNITRQGTRAIWSMNEGFVTIAEDYIRHDIYFIKTLKRFAPLMKKHFGERYEKLTDVFHDDDVSPIDSPA